MIKVSKNKVLPFAILSAGIMSLSATDVAAQSKASKMKVGIGGSFMSVLAFGKQNASFESTAGSTSRVGYDSFNIWNDSEIEFAGSTKLDNGISVSIHVELETDQSTANASSGNTIDESYAKISGVFGEVVVGSTGNATNVMATVAPNVGVTSSNDGDVGNVIIAPSAVGVTADTIIGTDNFMKVAFYSPSFSGFKIGASFAPSSAGTDVMPAVGGNAGTDTQEYNLALAYSSKLGSVDISADLGFGETHGEAASSSKAWRTGINLGFGNVVVGGSYRKTSEIDNLIAGTANSPEETAFDAGITYASGPWAIGANYLNVSAPKSSAIQGDDESSQLFLGASYTMGPGIELLGNVFHVEWDDESTADANNNDGWGLMAGISVAF
jgi:outer membrane protein OmpU